MDPYEFLTKTFNLKLGSLQLSPQYWQAGAIVFLIFLLILTLARVRYLYVHWSLGKSAVTMFFWGFLLALILEGFFIIGGRTLFTEILGWKNAPKPISTALDVTRAKLVDVLGVSDEISVSSAKENPTAEDLILDFQSLAPEEAEQVRSIICEP